jgi:hypothetical protein
MHFAISHNLLTCIARTGLFKQCADIENVYTTAGMNRCTSTFQPQIRQFNHRNIDIAIILPLHSDSYLLRTHGLAYALQNASLLPSYHHGCQAWKPIVIPDSQWPLRTPHCSRLITTVAKHGSPLSYQTVSGLYLNSEHYKAFV